MFENCRSLTKLPDISKWETNNVEDMSSMFSNCSNLKILPNITIWDTRKVKRLNNILQGCYSLANIPEISKWKIKNVEEINNILSNCYSSYNSKNLMNLFFSSSLNTYSSEQTKSEDYLQGIDDKKESFEIDDKENIFINDNDIDKDLKEQYYENFYN